MFYLEEESHLEMPLKSHNMWPAGILTWRVCVTSIHSLWQLQPNNKGLNGGTDQLNICTVWSLASCR